MTNIVTSALKAHCEVFMGKLALPIGARETFRAVIRRLESDEALGVRFAQFKYEFMFRRGDLDAILEQITGLEEQAHFDRRTLHFVFLMCCTDTLLKDYRKAGLYEKIYWDTMDDFRCKLLECIEREGIWGTFVPGWYDCFFTMERFALGRFQYEQSEFKGLESGLPYEKGGVKLNKGDTVINFHIPSSGKPLTDDARFDSYKTAFAFYQNLFAGGPVCFVCHSWLLYPGNKDIIPPGLNIRRFMDDFDIIHSEERAQFGDNWRVFGRFWNMPKEALPTDTALRRAFAEGLRSDKPIGSGYGVIVFDGEKILNK